MIDGISVYISLLLKYRYTSKCITIAQVDVLWCICAKFCAPIKSFKVAEILLEMIPVI